MDLLFVQTLKTDFLSVFRQMAHDNALVFGINFEDRKEMNFPQILQAFDSFIFDNDKPLPEFLYFPDVEIGCGETELKLVFGKVFDYLFNNKLSLLIEFS